jgi:3-hydroxyisobutyrate dehydrogenase-like beta-hydroxyacid dehydrogenase
MGPRRLYRSAMVVSSVTEGGNDADDDAGGPAAIGFVGLGVMGEPMATNLVARADVPVLVHDIRAEPVERLVEAGAVDAGSVGAVVERADVVLLSLPGGPELETVMAGDDGVLVALDRIGGVDRPQGRRRLIVDHTTAPVDLAIEMAARCRDVGADFLDAPIARTRQAAADGTLSIMVGGDETAMARALPVLSMMGTDVTHCGGPGAGQVTKLLNNMMLFQNVRALAEAHAIASALGSADLDGSVDLDIATVFEVIAGASGGSFALNNHGRKAVLVDTYPDNAFSTEYALKDLSYALDLARQAGVEATGAATVGRLMEAARDAGFGDAYFPVMRRVL